MKLRIKGDSLRLRLTRTEVQRLDESGTVEERVNFAGGASFVYRLKRDAQICALQASYADGAVEVRVPERIAQEWCRSEKVTLESVQRTSANAELRIVVEKDFACLAPRAGEDESDNFANPSNLRC